MCSCGRWSKSILDNCHSERSEESLPAAVALVGMLRLRRSFASLHSGCAQHDTALGLRQKVLSFFQPFDLARGALKDLANFRDSCGVVRTAGCGF
jgi:hypothetical protein